MVFMEVFNDVEAQIQTVADLTATLAMFDGAVGASLATGENLHRDLANLRRGHAVLEETRRLELMAKQSKDEEYMKLEKRCTAMEARIESAVKEKTIAEEKLDFEKSERMRVTEQWSAAELRHEAEVSERQRAEEERRRESEAVDEKLWLELRKFEKKCEELEKRNEELEAEQRLRVEASQKAEEHAEIWEDYKSELLEKVNEVESKHKILEKEYEELVEKRDFDFIEKIRIEEERKEAVGKYRIQVTERGKFEEKCKQLAEKLERDKAETIRKEKEFKEMVEKYRLEVTKCERLKKENVDLEKNYRDALLEILKEQSELHEKHELEQQEKLKLKRECEELKEKMERLLKVGDRADKMVAPDRKYGELHERYEYARLESLKLRDELKELTESHKLEQRAKLKAENELSEFQILMKGFKKDLSGNFVRNNTLSKEARNVRKAKNVETPLPMAAREASPGNGGFHASDAPELSSGGLVVLSDSDDDCAVGENKQKGLKRKHISSSTANNNVHAKIFKQDTSSPTVEMKQHQKLRRCDQKQ